MHYFFFNLYKIKFSILSKTNKLLIPFFVKNEMFYLLSFLLILNLTKIKKILPKNNSKYKVIVLSKTGGIDDLTVGQKNINRNILYFDCPRAFFKQIYEAIFENKYEDLIKNTDFNHNNEIRRLEKKYKNFLVTFIKKFKKNYFFNAFIGFNYNYYAEKDLHKTCNELKIPFLLLYKESVMTELQKEFRIYSRKRLTEKFEGYKIAVYSNIGKDILIKSGISTKDKIEIVGCSRLSLSFSYRKVIPKKQILYYAIESYRGLPKSMEQPGLKNITPFDKYKKYNWKKLHTKTLKILKKFAINNPDVSIIIKIKTGDKINSTQYKNLPKNIKLYKFGVGHKFLENSKIVIGWNTTSVLEGIAANRFMLLPYFFKKNKISKKIQLNLKLKKENYGYSENDFYKKLNFFVQKEYKSNVSYNNSFPLDYYLGNSNNDAKSKLNKFLTKNIIYKDL